MVQGDDRPALAAVHEQGRVAPGPGASVQVPITPPSSLVITTTPERGRP